MSASIAESDWKYLRKIQEELVQALCARINGKTKALLEVDTDSEADKYRAVFTHMNESDKLISDCFDDWRRSTIWLKIPHLRREGLLTDEHLEKMTDDIKDLLKKFDLLTQQDAEPGHGAYG